MSGRSYLLPLSERASLLPKPRVETAEVRAPLAELEEISSAEYPPKQRHGLRFEAILWPHTRFFVARLQESPLYLSPNLTRRLNGSPLQGVKLRRRPQVHEAPRYGFHSPATTPAATLSRFQRLVLAIARISPASAFSS